MSAATAFDAISDAIVSALSAPPAVAPVIVRGFARPMAEQHTRQIVVRLNAASGQMYAVKGAPINWDTRVDIECYARATGGGESEAAANSLLADAASRLLADETLGGAAQGIGPDIAIEWSADAGAQGVACATASITYAHRTSGAALT